MTARQLRVRTVVRFLFLTFLMLAMVLLAHAIPALIILAVGL